MTWESAVIIGLCAYSAIATTGIYLRLRRMGPRRPLVVKDPLSSSDKKAWAEAERKLGGAKVIPTVILMTQERDARLLDGQDD